MLKTAGLQVTHSQRGFAAIGKSCRTVKGISGSPLNEYEDFSIECMLFILMHEGTALMKENILETPEDGKITGETALQTILNDIQHGLREEGAVTSGRYLVAQK